MATQTMKIADKQRIALWNDVATAAQDFQDRGDDTNTWSVKPESVMAGDDAATAPCQLSHAVRLCMVFAADHVHALAHLVLEKQMMHFAAPASLVRGALETASTAVWLLESSRRPERARRLLQWHSKDISDLTNTARTLGVDSSLSDDNRKMRIAEVAERNSIEEKEYRNGYTSTTVVATAAGQVKSDLNIRAAWQVSSGYAHGRPWVVQTISDRDERESDVPGVWNARLTFNEDLLLALARSSLQTIKTASELYERRSVPYWQTPPS